MISQDDWTEVQEFVQGDIHTIIESTDWTGDKQAAAEALLDCLLGHFEDEVNYLEENGDVEVSYE